MTNSPPFSAFVIASHPLPVFQESIRSLLKEMPAAAELVVVLNGAQQEKETWLDSLADRRIRSIPVTKTCVSRLRNLAQKVCNSDWIHFLDDDVVVPEGFFRRVEKLKKENPDTLIFGGPNLTPSQDSLSARLLGATLSSPTAAPLVFQRYSCHENTNSGSEIPFMFCNLLVRRELLQKVPFQEDLYPNEETLFLFKIRRLKHQKHYSKDLFVFHHRRKTVTGFISQIFGYGVGRAKQTLIEPWSFPMSGLGIVLAAIASISIVQSFSMLAVFYLFASYAGWLSSSECRRLHLIGLSLAPILTFLLHLSYFSGFFFGIVRANLAKKESPHALHLRQPAKF